MTESLLEEWLEEFESLDQAQLRSFATEQEHNEDIALGIFQVLEERNKYIQLIDPVCSQLFEFYRTREAELQRFTLQFIPVLIRVYLGCVAQGEKRSCRSMETLLIGIYNLEIVDENGQPKAVSFRLPSIAQASIYHEPMTLAPSFLTSNALRRLEECNSKLVSWGPLQQVESLNAQNRLKVMTALMFLFNRQLSRLNKLTLDYLCKAVTKLVNQGFFRPGHHQRASYGSDSSSGSYVSLRPSPRIPLSSQLLLEFLHALYFAVFNGYDYAATQAIESVSHRACFEAYPDVQLLANAIRHSLRLNLSGQNIERPSVTSQTTVPAVSKSMITNASFRIKKLPEDIPIQNKEATNDTKNLVSISEEREDEVAAATITEKSGKSQKSSKDKEATISQKGLSKLPTFSGLGKKLQKDKDNKPGNKNGSTIESGTDQQSTKKNPNPTMKDNKGPNRNSAIIANVISINGENDNNDFKNILVRKESGGTRQYQSSPITANGPLILEIKNGGGGSMMMPGGEMEKVSLVSDSLQGHDHGDSSSITNSIDLSARSEDTDSQITADSVALVTLQDKEQISTIQVSSV